jgi:hypothetical protein
MKNLHDIIQKNSEKLLNDADNLYSLAWQDGREGLNRRAEINTEFGSLIESSQLSIIQAIDEMIEEVMEKKEQVHGFQTYHTCDEECEVNCKRLRDERKIFFDGWDDGRNLMKIDLMRIRSFLNTKTKLQ